MNFGIIVRNALQRAELPFDTEHLELARSYCNDNIQDLWQMTKADIRQASSTLTMVANQDEYQLPKDYDGMVLNSLRGPAANPRNIIYKDPIEWFRFTRNYSASTGVPNIFTFGKLMNIDTQLPAASIIRVISNLANYATGTVTTANGSNRIIGAGTTFTLGMVGLYFRKTGDTQSYKIQTFISTTEVQLDENYRGTSGAGATYAIGDVGIQVSVIGIVAGQEDSEQFILNGATVQVGVKSFTSVSAVIKSDLTGGIVTAKNLADVMTVATLAPAEYEIERQSIILWRIPASAEDLTFRYQRKHPVLRNDTDRTLILSKYHTLLSKLTEGDLREWADRSIPSKLANDISDGRMKFKADANDSSLWVTIPQEEGLGFGLTDINNRSIDQDFVSL